MAIKAKKFTTIFLVAALIAVPFHIFVNSRIVHAEGGCYEGFSGAIVNSRSGEKTNFSSGYNSSIDVVAEVGDELTFDSVSLDTLKTNSLYQATATAGKSSGGFTQLFGSEQKPSSAEVEFQYAPEKSEVTHDSAILNAVFVAESVPSVITLYATCEDVLAEQDGQPHLMGVTFEINLVDSIPSEGFTLSCDPVEITVNAGEITDFFITSEAIEGFDQDITFEQPVVLTSSQESIGSGQMDITITSDPDGVHHPSDQSIMEVATYAGATPDVYQITVTAHDKANEHTESCTSYLTVEPTPTYSLQVTPMVTEVLSGQNITYDITAVCDESGHTILGLHASTSFRNLTYVFADHDLECGQSTTLTVGNTAGIPTDQYSSPQQVLTQTITISGTLD